MKKTYFLTLLSALYTTTAISATPTCEQMPRCEDLGYSATISDSCENVLSCPFDLNYKICLDRSKCSHDCKIGDIFYADLTCGDIGEYIENGAHIPVGVVFMLTDKAGNVVQTETSRHGKVMSLNPVATMTWSEKTSTQILQLFNNNIESFLKSADGQESTSAFFSGKADTLAIIDALPDEQTAAKVAYEYYPSESLKDDPFVGQYQWYLPSAGELVYMLSTPRPTFSGAKALGDSFETRDKLNTVFKKLGKQTLPNKFMVTTEYPNGKAFNPAPLDTYTQYGNGQPYWHSNPKTTAKVSVRPIMAF